jgi:predicted transcriptional regulator
MSLQDRQLYRIFDANFNRTKEGLRVCEDICRYGWNKKTLTSSIKKIRHALTGLIEELDVLKALKSRDVTADVGKPTHVSESIRKDLNAVFWANAQRVKESLRVLEEVSKLVKPSTAQAIKTLRYKFYELEQKAVKRR